MPVLTLRRLSFQYPNSEAGPRRVLDDLNLRIDSGEIVSVIGPSGSGKSTLLRLCAGVLNPSAGEVIYWDDRRSVDDRPWIPLVEQTPALLPWRDTVGNIALYGEILGRPNIREEALRYCHQVGLSGFERYRPAELSGGMQTRVAIARALSIADRLILLDEPFSNLDELTRFRILEDFAKEVRSRSLSAMVVSHNIEEATYIGDRIAMFGGTPATFSQIICPGLVKSGVQSTLANPQFIAVVAELRALAKDQWGEKSV
jgi:NitT/TauT family transport system ATP-binding protein